MFQILLALGAPLGKMAWGGKYSILPLQLRIGSLISAGLLILAIFIFLEKAKLLYIFNSNLLVNLLVWFFVVIFSSSSLGNILSESKLEKSIMMPIAITLMLLALIVAIG